MKLLQLDGSRLLLKIFWTFSICFHGPGVFLKGLENAFLQLNLHGNLFSQKKN